MSASTETLRRTPLYDRHEAAGARLVPFAGWEMPVQYEGIRQEHVTVRAHAGVFDVSHMGEIETSGPDAEAFLQRILSNDVTKLAEGGAQYACSASQDGGVLDDLFTYRLGADRFLTVTNAPTTRRTWPGSSEHAARLRRDRHRTPPELRHARAPGPRGARGGPRHIERDAPARMRAPRARRWPA